MQEQFSNVRISLQLGLEALQAQRNHLEDIEDELAAELNRLLVNRMNKGTNEGTAVALF